MNNADYAHAPRTDATDATEDDEREVPLDFVPLKRVRAHSTSIKRLSKRQLAADTRIADVELSGISLDDRTRPQTRAECLPGGRNAARPCPYVSCAKHLYLDVHPRSGAIKLNFPDLEVHELKETCALDVADRGGITLEEAGALMNLTRERIRQLETKGVVSMRAAARHQGAALVEWEMEQRDDERASLARLRHVAFTRTRPPRIPAYAAKPEPASYDHRPYFFNDLRAKLSAELAAKQVRFRYQRPAAQRDAEDPRTTLRALHNRKLGVKDARAQWNDTDTLFPQRMVWPEGSPNQQHKRLGAKEVDARRMVTALDGQVDHQGRVATRDIPRAPASSVPLAYSRAALAEVREALSDARLHRFADSVVLDGTEVEDEATELVTETLEEVRPFSRDEDGDDDAPFAFESGEDPEAPPGY